MRNIFIILLTGILLLAGCAKQPDAAKPTTPQETPATDDGPAATDNPALKVMLNIWEQFQGNKDDYVGGCSTEYRTATPWQVPLSDEDFLQGALFLSEGQLGKVEAVASLMHGLSTNNLTAGAVVLEDGTDYKAFADEIRNRILGNQWVCGRPGGMRIVKVENCLLIMYGSGTHSGGFVDAINRAYQNAEVLCREAI